MNLGATRQLFVLHSPDDREWVETYVASALNDAALTYGLQAQLPPGTPVSIALEEAIGSSEVQLLVVSGALVEDRLNTLVVALASHRELEADGWSLVPFVLDRAVYDRLRLLVSMRSPIYADEDWEAGLQQLAAFFGRELAEPEAPVKHRYLGLRPYAAEDRDHFFGRDAEIVELSRRIAKRSLNVVTGPSGSGKSSLVNAGVMPRINELDPDGRRWATVAVVPSDHAAEDLRLELDPEGVCPSLELAVAGVLQGADELLVFVDQAEPLLSDPRDPFFAALAELVATEHVHVVLAIRDEFKPELAATVLGEVAARSEYALPSLDRDGLRQAIAGPAREVGVTVARELAERLVAEAGSEPGILPFVQETMIALWPSVRRNYLPYHAYDRLVADGAVEEGRATGLYAALANHADDVRAELAADDGTLIRLLLRLVHFGSERPIVRRPQTLAQLVAGSRETSTAMLAAVDEMTHEDARILSRRERRTGPGKRDSPDERVLVSLAHDSLLSHWPFLRGLLRDEDRVKAEVLRREAEQDATRARSNGRSYLWRGRRLLRGIGWARQNRPDVSPAVAGFLAKSIAWSSARTLAIAVLALFISVAAADWLDERAARRIAAGDQMMSSLDGVSIERYEVSNERYRECVDEGPCDSPGLGRNDHPYDEAGRERLPVVNVTAFDAYAFCAWIGRRLPTWDEWQQAATGGGVRMYPWDDGAAPDSDHIHVFVAADAPTSEVDITPEMEDAIDELIGRSSVTPDLISTVATWVPEVELEPLAMDWPEMDLEERARRLLQFAGQSEEDDLDVVPVDGLRDGATPDEPPIHHLVGNAGEWTTTLSGCDAPGDACIWDGVTRSSLLAVGGLTVDLAEIFSPLESPPADARDSRGFRCAATEEER